MTRPLMLDTNMASYIIKRTYPEVLVRLYILAWESAAADIYATLRTQQEREGRPLGVLDMLIAAHALATGATLVSADAAFGGVEGANLEDWTKPAP